MEYLIQELKDAPLTKFERMDISQIKERMAAKWDERYREVGIEPYYEGACISDLEVLADLWRKYVGRV